MAILMQLVIPRKKTPMVIEDEVVERERIKSARMRWIWTINC